MSRDMYIYYVSSKNGDVTSEDCDIYMAPADREIMDLVLKDPTATIRQLHRLNIATLTHHLASFLTDFEVNQAMSSWAKRNGLSLIKRFKVGNEWRFIYCNVHRLIALGQVPNPADLYEPPLIPLPQLTPQQKIQAEVTEAKLHLTAMLKDKVPEEDLKIILGRIDRIKEQFG